MPSHQSSQLCCRNSIGPYQQNTINQQKSAVHAKPTSPLSSLFLSSFLTIPRDACSLALAVYTRTWHGFIINIRMPFIYRTLNRFPNPNCALDRVKLEQPSPLEQESSLLSMGELEAGKQGNQGRWTQDQNFKFVVFVHYYQDIFSSRHKRKVCKIFRTFSEYLTERTAAQCRSHYQKMIIKHKTIAKLKKYYRGLYGEKAYCQELERFKAEWEVTHPPALKNSEEIKQCNEIAVQTESLPTICETCQGFKSESQLVSAPLFNSINYWGDLSQYQSQSCMNFFYWVPQYQNE